MIETLSECSIRMAREHLEYLQFCLAECELDEEIEGVELVIEEVQEDLDYWLARVKGYEG